MIIPHIDRSFFITHWTNFVQLSDFHSESVRPHDGCIRKSLAFRHFALWHVYCLFIHSKYYFEGRRYIDANISKKKWKKKHRSRIRVRFFQRLTVGLFFHHWFFTLIFLSFHCSFCYAFNNILLTTQIKNNNWYHTQN